MGSIPIRAAEMTSERSEVWLSRQVRGNRSPRRFDPSNPTASDEENGSDKTTYGQRCRWEHAWFGTRRFSVRPRGARLDGPLQTE